LQRHGKASSDSLFRRMQDWLHRHLPSDAKDDMNRVEDFLDVSFHSMTLSLAASAHNFNPAHGVPAILRPNSPATTNHLKDWIDSFVRPLAAQVVPDFKPSGPSSFGDDEVFNEAQYILQFLSLYKLLKEAVKLADGELLFSLYKPSLAVFHQFHRTKYR